MWLAILGVAKGNRRLKMKGFISEYGLMIVEGVGGCMLLALVYQCIFGSAFSQYVNQFVQALIGG